MLPGHAVIDKCVQMYEDNVLHYLSPQQCRDDEVKFKKDRDDKMLSVDGAGHVSLRSQPAEVDADVSSDLLLKLALTRRGLALDQAGVITFSEHERWVEALFVARFRDPPDSYARVTLQQLMHADRQLFVEAADRTRQGIQLVADGKPVDKIWHDAMSCNKVTHLLLWCCLRRRVTALGLMMIAGMARGKAKEKGKAKAKAQSACLLNFPTVCRRLLAGYQFALITISVAVSGP